MDNQEKGFTTLVTKTNSACIDKNDSPKQSTIKATYIDTTVFPKTTTTISTIPKNYLATTIATIPEKSSTTKNNQKNYITTTSTIPKTFTTTTTTSTLPKTTTTLSTIPETFTTTTTTSTAVSKI